MNDEQHDPLDYTQNTKYHIQGLSTDSNPHYFEIYLDREFARRLAATSITEDRQQKASENLCELFLDGMHPNISFIEDTYLISKLKIADQETGLHYHEETENHIEYGTKNIDTHKQCVEVISVFTKWVEYATQLLSTEEEPPIPTETPIDEWERHNDTFNYNPPDQPPEYWGSEEHNELADRVIQKSEQWKCTKCSTSPFRSIEKARSHVKNQHHESLIESAKNKANWDNNTDSQSPNSNSSEEKPVDDSETSSTKQKPTKVKKNENEQLGDYT